MRWCPLSAQVAEVRLIWEARRGEEAGLPCAVRLLEVVVRVSLQMVVTHQHILD